MGYFKQGGGRFLANVANPMAALPAAAKEHASILSPQLQPPRIECARSLERPTHSACSTTQPRPASVQDSRSPSRVTQSRKPSADWFDILFIASSLLTKGSRSLSNSSCPLGEPTHLRKKRSWLKNPPNQSENLCFATYCAICRAVARLTNTPIWSIMLAAPEPKLRVLCESTI